MPQHIFHQHVLFATQDLQLSAAMKAAALGKNGGLPLFPYEQLTGFEAEDSDCKVHYDVYSQF